jgi:putative flippase GtrA
MHNLLSHKAVKQFFAYGAVGLLNTALNFAFINLGIFLTGATQGPVFIFVSAVVFFLIVIHSFVWNRYLIFARNNPRELHREYATFFLVTGFSSLLNLGVLHLLVDVIGAPQGVSMHLWANIALAVTIPISVILNFFGYKFLVFPE